MTLFPYWSIFSCCNSLHALVQRQANQSFDTDLTHHNDRFDGNPAFFAPKTLVVPIHQVSTSHLHSVKRAFRNAKISKTTRERIRDHLLRASSSRTTRAALLIWGLLVLGFHLNGIVTATRFPVKAKGGCKQMLHPWFANAAACSVFDYNCNMAGTVTADSDLMGINAATLAVLIFSHCSSLPVPPAIQNFTNLLGLEVYNSSVSRWDTHAAVSAAQYQRLAYVLVIRSNMTRFPEGMMTRLPPSLQDIEFAECNLTSLPDDLDHYWHPVSVVFIEKCDIASSPPVLMRLRVGEFSLVGNRIESIIPPWTSPVTTFTGGLSLTRNPLRKHP